MRRGKIRLGMPTLIELESFEENAALCAELGLDFVELNMSLKKQRDDCTDGHPDFV